MNLENIKEIKKGEDFQELGIGQKVLLWGIYEEYFVGRTNSKDNGSDFPTTISEKKGRICERQIKGLGKNGRMQDYTKKIIQEDNRKYDVYKKILEEKFK